MTTPPAPIVEMRVGTDDGWTLNDPTLSRLTAGNVLDGPLDGYVDLSAYAVSVDWNVGASSDTDFTTINPSYAQIRFYDPDRDLDPNGTGLYSSKITYNTPVRISVKDWYSSTRYRQFTGFLWSASWSAGYTTVTAVDYLSKLAAVTLTATTSQGAGETGSARIARLLANSSVNLPVTYGTGTTYTRQATDLSGNVLTNISNIVETEWGLFASNDGGQTYSYTPSWYTGRRVALMQLVDGYLPAVAEAGGAGVDSSRVRNYATVKGSGLTDSIASSSTSIAIYGRRTIEKSTNFAVQADQDNYATSLVTWYATPVDTSPRRMRFVITTANTTVKAPWLVYSAFFQSGTALGRYITMSTSIGYTGTPFVVGYSVSYTSTAEYSITAVLADLGGSASSGYWTLTNGTNSYLDFGRVLKT